MLLNWGFSRTRTLLRVAPHAYAPLAILQQPLRPPAARRGPQRRRPKPSHAPQVHPGRNVGLGKDYTLFALVEGIVTFERNSKLQKVSVVPFEDYTVPEGQQLKEGSRKMRRRAASLAALEAEVAAAMSAANLA